FRADVVVLRHIWHLADSWHRSFWLVGGAIHGSHGDASEERIYFEQRCSSVVYCSHGGRFCHHHDSWHSHGAYAGHESEDSILLSCVWGFVSVDSDDDF